MGEQPVAELLESAAGGDEAAWNALVDRFGNLVWSVARGLRLDAATAADVSQTTWLRLVEHLDRIRDPERLAGWLATTARNEGLRLLKQQQRYIPTVIVEDMQDPAFVDAEIGLIEDESQAEVVAAFQTLTEDCQELLRLCTADPPMDYEDIAAVVDRPIGSIGPTRARCLERLRRALAAVGIGQETNK